MSDTAKLQKFIEAALTNPRHPVYALGMHQSPILQHYAVNVSLLKSLTPEEWVKQYPAHAAKIEEVMALCEAEQTGAAAVPDEIAALKSEIAALKAKLNEPKKPDESDKDDDDEDDEEAPESQEA